jgi:hypothetical protein
MVEVGIAEYFSIGEALGIIGTMFIVLYFSRKQMQSLSVDIETKVLNDLDEKMHGLTRMAVERPQLTKLISNIESDWSAEVAYTYHILYIFAHVYHMRQRKVLRDNE